MIYLLPAKINKNNSTQKGRDQIVSYAVPVYPDTLVWIRDFSYSYNEPLAKRYYAHPAYGNYPVVGVTWKQAVAFCHWRTHIQNADFAKRKLPLTVITDYRTKQSGNTPQEVVVQVRCFHGVLHI